MAPLPQLPNPEEARKLAELGISIGGQMISNEISRKSSEIATKKAVEAGIERIAEAASTGAAAGASATITKTVGGMIASQLLMEGVKHTPKLFQKLGEAIGLNSLEKGKALGAKMILDVLEREFRYGNPLVILSHINSLISLNPVLNTVKNSLIVAGTIAVGYQLFEKGTVWTASRTAIESTTEAVRAAATNKIIYFMDTKVLSSDKAQIYLGQLEKLKNKQAILEFMERITNMRG